MSQIPNKNFDDAKFSNSEPEFPLKHRFPPTKKAFLSPSKYISYL